MIFIQTLAFAVRSVCNAVIRSCYELARDHHILHHMHEYTLQISRDYMVHGTKHSLTDVTASSS